MDKESQHDIVSDVIRVSKTLGRIPSRDEYLEHSKFSNHAIVVNFGSYTHLLHATGLKVDKKKKPDKQEIRKRVFEHIKEQSTAKKKIKTRDKKYKCIQIWGDRHFPFGHIDTIKFLIAIKKKYKPDLVIDIGDGEDYHALSFHDHSPELFSPGHELQACIDLNKELYKEFPKVWTVDSNHGSMVFRKGLHHGIPRHVIKSYQEILQAPPGWKWFDEIIVQMSNGEKVLFCHSLGANVLAVSKKLGISVVQGHHHSLHGVHFWANRLKKFFAAQTGCTIDDTSLALAYNKSTVERPLLGGLVIVDGYPIPIPMNLDSNGRWDGKLP